MKKIIYTHKGEMHADEITAVALIKLFVCESIQVIRVEHQASNFPNADFVIDVGGKHDGEIFFDHHQYQGGKAAAGLIWDYIGLESQYPKISQLVRLVDADDTGEQKSGDFELPAIIKTFNAVDPYSEEQNQQFEKAVDLVHKILSSYKREEDEYQEAKKICEESQNFEEFEDVVLLKKFTPQWSKIFNGENRPDIEAVVWWDEHQQNWQAQTTPSSYGSFAATGKMFIPDDAMDFVHAAGFFAVAKTKEIMVKFLQNSRK